MIECPVCHVLFDPDKGQVFLDDTYCSPACAEAAAEEGRNVLPAEEPEEKA